MSSVGQLQVFPIYYYNYFGQRNLMDIKKDKTKKNQMKVIVGGPQGTGKTSLCHKIAKDQCNQYYATLGIDFCTRQVTKNGVKFKIYFWDLAGVEKRFSQIQQKLYKDVDVLFLCFDMNECFDFDRMQKAVDQYTIFAKSIDILLIGCKCDLHKNVTDEKIQQFMQKNKKITKFFETSSFMDSGIRDLRQFIIDNYSQRIWEIKDAQLTKQLQNSKSRCTLF